MTRWCSAFDRVDASPVVPHGDQRRAAAVDLPVDQPAKGRLVERAVAKRGDQSGDRTVRTFDWSFRAGMAIASCDASTRRIAGDMFIQRLIRSLRALCPACLPNNRDSASRHAARSPLFGLALLATTALTASGPSMAQDAAAGTARASRWWRRSRRKCRSVIDRWEYLSSTRNRSFDEYAGFVLAYPGFPQEERLRLRAEGALDDEADPPRNAGRLFRSQPAAHQCRRAHAMRWR